MTPWLSEALKKGWKSTYLSFGKLHQHALWKDIKVLPAPFTVPVPVEEIASLLARSGYNRIQCLKIAERYRESKRA